MKLKLSNAKFISFFYKLRNDIDNRKNFIYSKKLVLMIMINGLKIH